MTSEIIEKIKKLLTFKEGAERINSQAEIENATARIQELLLKHNLTLSEVESHETKTKQVFTKHNKEVHLNKVDGDWQLSLGTTIAKNFLCELVVSKKDSTNMIFYILGSPENVEIVSQTLDYLIPMIKLMATKAFSNQDLFKKNKFKRDYCKGCAMGISKKLKEENARLAAENNKIQSLVISNKEKLNSFMKDEFAKLGSKKSSYNMNEAFASGYRDGQKIDVSPKTKIPGSTPNPQRIAG